MIHENRFLSQVNLKLYLRSICIHNWHLQMYIRANTNNCNNTCSFQALSIVFQWKYFFNIVTENYSLDGHVNQAGICWSILVNLKYSQLQLQFLNSNININMYSIKIWFFCILTVAWEDIRIYIPDISKRRLVQLKTCLLRYP